MERLALVAKPSGNPKNKGSRERSLTLNPDPERKGPGKELPVLRQRKTRGGSEAGTLRRERARDPSESSVRRWKNLERPNRGHPVLRVSRAPHVIPKRRSATCSVNPVLDHSTGIVHYVIHTKQLFNLIVKPVRPGLCSTTLQAYSPISCSIHGRLVVGST